MAGTPESGVGEDERGGQIPVQEQFLRTVEIGKDGVEQAGALDEARFQISPLLRRNEQRNRVQAPGPVGPQRVTVNVVADAVLADALPGGLPAVGKFLPAERSQRSDVAIPMGTKNAGLHAHLVVNARSLAVFGGQ